MNTNITASQIYSKNFNHNSKNTWKYTLSCKDKLNGNHTDTRDWLSLVSRIEHTSPSYTLFQAELEKHDVVVKIGPVVLKKEFDIGMK